MCMYNPTHTINSYKITILQCVLCSVMTLHINEWFYDMWVEHEYTKL